MGLQGYTQVSVGLALGEIARCSRRAVPRAGEKGPCIFSSLALGLVGVLLGPLQCDPWCPHLVSAASLTVRSSMLTGGLAAFC